MFSKIKAQLNTKSQAEFKRVFNDNILSDQARKSIIDNIRSENKQKNTIAVLILILTPLLLVIKAIFEGFLYH